MAFIAWALMRGWAHAVQGAKVSDRTRRRQRNELLLMIVGGYLLAWGMALYFSLWPPGTPQPAFARAVAGGYRAYHPLITGFTTYAIAIPFLALMLWALGRWLLLLAGIGVNTRFSRRRFLMEWLCVLVAVYLYGACVTALGIH